MNGQYFQNDFWYYAILVLTMRKMLTFNLKYLAAFLAIASSYTLYFDSAHRRMPGKYLKKSQIMNLGLYWHISYPLPPNHKGSGIFWQLVDLHSFVHQSAALKREHFYSVYSWRTGAITFLLFFGGGVNCLPDSQWNNPTHMATSHNGYNVYFKVYMTQNRLW